jgi:O-antigen/teichoic acid export membrane protein
LWVILGQGLRLLVQLAYFVLIARILHREGYGAFSGAVALVAVLAPFAGWGSGNLLIKNVSREPRTFRRYWGRALIVSGLSGLALTVLALLLASWILPMSITAALVLWVALSDLLFARMLETSGQAFQAFHQLHKTTLLWVSLSLSRLCAVLVLPHIHAHDVLMAWAVLYLSGTAIVTLAACIWVSLELGKPDLEMTGWHTEIGEGFYFASSLSAQRIYMDSDKALLTRLSSLEAAGVYAAASRVIDVAVVPMNALLSAAYARFFMHGREGVRGTLRFSRKLLPPAIGYAVLAGIGLYVLAPFAPKLLGAEFAETATAIRWLAVVPLLMTLHRFAADSLTGAGWQAARSGIEFVAAGFNAGMNLYLLPRYSWFGAVWATLITEIFLAIALGAVLWHLARSQQTPSARGIGGTI